MKSVIWEQGAAGNRKMEAKAFLRGEREKLKVSREQTEMTKSKEKRKLLKRARGKNQGILESLDPGPGVWTRKCWILNSLEF